jgi:sulfane dehydrogenase subunit SoxC
MTKALDDVLVAYGQNGEALRPENGYPLRLIVPGWEGNVNVKWLRRITVVDRPYMTRMESTAHASLMPDGKARQFNFVMEAKSVITFPSGGQQLPGPGFYEIRGLAWSGRGLVRRVEVSTDGGKTWQDAGLQEPVLPLAHTCYVQPTLTELVRVRGRNFVYANNAIQSWKVAADGSVHNVQA